MAEAPNSTIVAASTPPGRGGIGIVRLSGPAARPLAETIARCQLKPRTPQLAHLWIDDRRIDQGLLLWFPAPASFTGQDVVEFHTHGSPIVLRMLIEECMRGGARAAEPGEFSKLAFLNDKLDLSQAEAIADLIDAGSAAAVRAAARSLDGALSRRVEQLLEQLIELRVYCEAAIDFVDEDIEFLEQDHFQKKLLGCREAVQSCLEVGQSSRVLSDGLKLVILGRPNAGKSSLLNRLADSDRAIVTEIAGTTRDTIQERIDLDGLPLEITDTAGLNDNPDPVEKIGIERALASAKHADLILALFDDSSETAENTEALLRTYLGPGSDAGQPILLLANKIDLSGAAPGLRKDGNCLALSAKTGEGIDQLKSLLKQRAQFSEQEPEFLARARHLDALQKAQQHLSTAVQLLEARTAPELIAEELRCSHIALQAITGASSADEFLGEIFSRFCIGK